MCRLAAVPVAALLVPWVAAVGQLATLQTGARVRVDAPRVAPQELIGTLTAAAGDTISLLARRERAFRSDTTMVLSIPMSQVRQLDVSAGKSRARGALVGGALGLALGAGVTMTFVAIGGAGGGSDEADAYPFVIGGAATLIGVPLGIVVGGKRGVEKWQRVHPAKKR
jgi:hypothetical protein